MSVLTKQVEDLTNPVEEPVEQIEDLTDLI